MSTWTLHAIVIGEPSPGAMRAGLMNNSTEARLLCVADTGLSYPALNGSPQSEMSGGSPHQCTTDQQFALVLAGETRFVWINVPHELFVRDSTTVRVEVGIVERAASGAEKPSELVPIVWEGTIRQAMENGRRWSIAAKVK